MTAHAPIRLHDVTLGYGGHPAVHHLSGAIAAGARLAVIGPNGAGKSTLLRALTGLLQPLGGRIEMPAGVRVAYLPQQATLERDFPADVGEFAAMGLWRECGALGGLNAAQRARVHEALEAVGLQGWARQPLEALSGGQLQRVLFARLLLQDADVLLLDEPFAGIDERTCDDLLALAHSWSAQGKTLVAVLHDARQVRAAFAEALLLAREPLAWGAANEVLDFAAQRQAAMPAAFDPHAPLCVQDGAHEHAHEHGEGH